MKKYEPIKLSAKKYRVTPEHYSLAVKLINRLNAMRDSEEERDVIADFFAALSHDVSQRLEDVGNQTTSKLGEAEEEREIK